MRYTCKNLISIARSGPGVILFGLVVGCANPVEPLPKAATSPIETTPPPETAPEEIEPPSPPPTCEERIQGLLLQPSNERLEAYRKALPHIVLRARVLPVIYGSMPERTENPRARHAREVLSHSGGARRRVRALKELHVDDRGFLRDVFLSQGYFFDDRVDVAPAMIKEIALPDLFDAPVIYRLRGDGVESLSRGESDYYDEDGQRAALLLNDRVAESPDALLPPLHFDVREVRRQTGAQRVLATAVGASSASVNLVFPDGEIRPALLEIADGTTRVACLGGNPDTLNTTLDEARRFWAQHRRIIDAAEKLVSERTMFDEPKDELEDVQEDGDLRLEWMKAYRRRQKTYLFREVEYPVFDREGNPTPPEVCVDFIFDVWERSFGTWYRKRRGLRPALGLQPPAHRHGARLRRGREHPPREVRRPAPAVDSV